MAGRRATEKIGDEAVAAKTGRHWKEWFEALDREGAKEMGHREIVAVAREQGASDWWAQMITVAYEQVRGKRQVGQKPEGFEVSASRTIAAPVTAAYRAWLDARQRQTWLPGASFTVRKATANKSLRLTWDEKDTRVEVNFYRKGAGRSQVTVQHSRLSGAAASERMKAFWKTRLESLRTLLEEAS